MRTSDPLAESVAATETRIGVGVWGLGRHARRKILPALRASSSTTLVGVTSRNQEIAHCEADLNQCVVWPTPEAMLDDPAVDAVYVATPTGLHFDHGMRALDAGKHLWCEKPLATHLAQADGLVRESEERNLALCEGLMYLYHPHLSEIASMISEPAFGEVLTLKSEFGLPHLDHPGFRFNKDLGGGALLDLATYPLSAALALLGSPLRIVEASVNGASDSEVDTYGYAVMRTDSSTVVFLEWGYERAYRNSISIWGEFGSLSSDFVFSKPPDHSARIRKRNRYGEEEIVVVAESNSFALMFETFARAVRDEELRTLLRNEAHLRAWYLEALRSEV